MEYKTEIETCSWIAELRAAVLMALPTLRWRRHGIGALQAYLSEREPEVRVHIWHPDLLVPGMEFPRSVHTHRFSMQSTVLVGAINHTEYKTQPLEDDEWASNVFQPCEVTHARVQGGHDLPVPVGPPVRIYGERLTIVQGNTYWFPKHVFHMTEPTQLAVTIMTKRDQEPTKALVLSRGGEQAQHGFTAPLTEEQMAPFVAQAAEALR